MIKWARHHKGGYEVSSKGDVRYSAFSAKLPCGRTIEQVYQCDVKGYDVGGTKWRLGKGKPSLIEYPDGLYNEYLNLWRTWVDNNPLPFRLLYLKAIKHDNTLTDMFASGEVNQARALAELLNEEYA